MSHVCSVVSALRCGRYNSSALTDRLKAASDSGTGQVFNDLWIDWNSGIQTQLSN